MTTQTRWIFEAPLAAEQGYYTNAYAHPQSHSHPELEWEAPALTCHNLLDTKANNIIQAAQNSKIEVKWRGFQVVWRIIGEYYSNEASKVSAVGWMQNLPGLETQRDLYAPTKVIYGKIFVGSQFVLNTNTTFFARRVLQVGHELQHIDQYRRGVTNQDEREFLAFHWASMAPEKPGTGCLQHAIRRDMIDCALGYLNCLSSADQQKYATERSALLSRRTSVNGTHGNPLTNPPTSCQRCNP